VSFRKQDVLNGVAGNTDQRSGNSSLREDRSGIGGRDIVGTQMHSICSARNGCVYSGINKNFCASSGQALNVDNAHILYRASSQLDKLARVKILLAYLNRVDTCAGRSGNAIQQQPQALIALGRELSAIGYVIEKQFLDISRTGASAMQRGRTFPPLLMA